MGRKKKLINNTNVPQYAVERFARCVFDDIRADFARPEVQAEFALWLAEREQHKKTRAAKTAALVSVMGNKQIIRTRFRFGRYGSGYIALVYHKRTEPASIFLNGSPLFCLTEQLGRGIRYPDGKITKPARKKGGIPMSQTDIARVDKNFAAPEVHEAGMKFYDINRPPFRLYGLYREADETDYKRLPHRVAASVDNPSVKRLYTNTSGGRIRFRTDSSRIILRCFWPSRCQFSHMPMSGTSCFDLYADGVYCNVLFPEAKQSEHSIPIENGYQSCCCFEDARMRDILIHFPLYNDVSQVFIAVEEQAQVLAGEEYARPGTIVYYGSSITQGGCASHAGNAYPAILSRRLNMDYLNLGFSGGCRAEPEIASYLAGLPMRALVYDYDYNAPNAEFLQKTHEALFRTFRQAQPDTPVLIVSAADRAFGSDIEKRKAVIRKTYENALAAGDRNVCFLDGQTIYDPVGWDLCTVDRCHPTDLGFWCMANAVGRHLEAILGL